MRWIFRVLPNSETLELSTCGQFSSPFDGRPLRLGELSTVLMRTVFVVLPNSVTFEPLPLPFGKGFHRLSLGLNPRRESPHSCADFVLSGNHDVKLLTRWRLFLI